MGNAVIRVIMGKEEEAKPEGQRLDEAYRLCNIGDWRTVDRKDRDGRHAYTALLSQFIAKSNRDKLQQGKS